VKSHYATFEKCRFEVDIFKFLLLPSTYYSYCHSEETMAALICHKITTLESCNHQMWQESSEITCPGNAASQRLKDFHCSWADSSFTSIESLDDRSVSKYDVDDLCIQGVLGHGSFSTAHLVNVKESHAGDFNSEGTCVMKRLKPVIDMNRRASNIAASDLALEAQILANLQHKNIISLRGICSGDLHESLNKGDFFILVDLLVDTLDARLLRWAKRKFSFLPPSKPRVTDRLRDVAVGITDGMTYLHSKQLIFR
jgi:serine/threonine protein kinase